MNSRAFDALARRLATKLSRRSVLRGMAGGGGAVIAAQTTTLAKPPEKIELCHKPGTPAEKTLTVAAPAVAAHLGHGDHLGPCGVCIEGAEECDGTGFRTCAEGAWVYRECAPGTACRQEGQSIVCDFSTGP